MRESLLNIREVLEKRQIAIYFLAIALGCGLALLAPGTSRLQAAINPALAVMLFATFLQVPLAEIGQAFSRGRFMVALLGGNFVIIPLLVAGLSWFLPNDSSIRLGFFMVLLAPCIDYVVTFSHIGQANSRLLLAATPVLLVTQMLLLPVYLGMLLGPEAAQLVRIGPFVEAFVWLIAIPLLLAAILQFVAARSRRVRRTADILNLLPVPSTAGVLLIVIAAVLPQLGHASQSAISVAPLYVAFAVLAPLLGWLVGRVFKLGASETRAIAFSLSTRNSLVVLPLAFAVPEAMPVLPAVIVTQTLVELVSELVYMQVMPRLGRE